VFGASVRVGVGGSVCGKDGLGTRAIAREWICLWCHAGGRGLARSGLLLVKHRSDPVMG